MKLNPDCIRDLMLTLEEITCINVGSRYTFRGVNCESLAHKFLNAYEESEIAYTPIQLSESGYIEMPFKCDNKIRVVEMGNILYVTPKGHELISNMKAEGNWDKIKKILAPMGGVSLAVIEAISSGITGALIAKATGQA